MQSCVLLLGEGGAGAVTALLALQHYPDERHGPERHPRESRDGWGGYGSERRMNEGRGIPPPTRLVIRRQAAAALRPRVGKMRVWVGAWCKAFLLMGPLSLCSGCARDLGVRRGSVSSSPSQVRLGAFSCPGQSSTPS